MGHPVILSASLFHRKKGLGDKTATMGFWAFWPGVGFYPRELADLGMASQSLNFFLYSEKL